MSDVIFEVMVVFTLPLGDGLESTGNLKRQSLSPLPNFARRRRWKCFRPEKKRMRISSSTILVKTFRPSVQHWSKKFSRIIWRFYWKTRRSRNRDGKGWQFVPCATTKGETRHWIRVGTQCATSAPPSVPVPTSPYTPSGREFALFVNKKPDQTWKYSCDFSIRNFLIILFILFCINNSINLNYKR